MYFRSRIVRVNAVCIVNQPKLQEFVAQGGVGVKRNRRRHERNIQSDRTLGTGKILGSKKAASRSRSQSGTHSRRGMWGLPLGFGHGGRTLSDRLAARSGA